MKKPLVSIMMPVFNGLPLIEASLKSLKNQTYFNWECIIVDDGSTDGTSIYLDTLEDNRFIVHHFYKNKGRPYARQKALDLAKGDFLAMLDAGDIYHPTKLELQIKVFEQHPSVDLVSSKMCSFGTQTDKLYGRGSSYGGEIAYNGSNLPLHGPSMIRMTIAKQFRYNLKMKLGQDTDYMERLLVDKYYFVVPKYLYYYSELDSVNKNKIRKAYKLRLLRYYEKRSWRKFLVSFLKYVYSLIVFPFVSIDYILSKRGAELTDEEIKEFESIVKPLLIR